MRTTQCSRGKKKSNVAVSGGAGAGSAGKNAE